MKPRTGYIQHTSTGFRVRFRVGGRDLWFRLSATDEAGAEAEAREHAKRLTSSDAPTVADTLRGAAERIEREAPADGMQISDAWAAYVAHRRTAGTKQRTVMSYESSWRVFVDWCASIGVTAMGRVTPRVAERYCDYLDKSDTCYGTNVIRLAVAKLVWSRATTIPSPFDDARLVRVDAVAKRKAFTLAQCETILNATEPGEFGDMVWVAAYTGLRVSDVATLDAADVRLDSMMISKVPMKTGERSANPIQARVAIHPAIQGIVARRVAGRSSGPLFPSCADYSPGVRSRLVVAMKALLHACGLVTTAERQRGNRASLYCWHSFRHMLQTQLVESGAHAMVCDAILAHARKDSMGQYYTDLSDKAITAAIVKAMPDMRRERGIIEMRSGAA